MCQLIVVTKIINEDPINYVRTNLSHCDEIIIVLLYLFVPEMTLPRLYIKNFL